MASEPLCLTLHEILLVMSEQQKPSWIPTMACAALMPIMGNKCTTEYVHQLVTVHTCAVRMLPAISRSVSAFVATASPLGSLLTMYKKKTMEMAQHIRPM